jgi:hypothetical protein
MEANDRIVLTWESVEITEYRATVSVERYAELLGMTVPEVLSFETASQAANESTLDLADELANVEDNDDPAVVGDTFTRESIEVNVRV